MSSMGRFKQDALDLLFGVAYVASACVFLLSLLAMTIRFFVNREWSFLMGFFFGFILSGALAGSAYFFMRKLQDAYDKKDAEVKAAAKLCVEAQEMCDSCVASGMYEDAEFYRKKAEDLRTQLLRLL